MTEEYFYKRLKTFSDYSSVNVCDCYTIRLHILSFVERNINEFNIKYNKCLFKVLGKKINEFYEFVNTLFPNIYTIQFDNIIGDILSKGNTQ